MMGNQNHLRRSNAPAVLEPQYDGRILLRCCRKPANKLDVVQQFCNFTFQLPFGAISTGWPTEIGTAFTNAHAWHMDLGREPFQG